MVVGLEFRKVVKGVLQSFQTCDIMRLQLYHVDLRIFLERVSWRKELQGFTYRFLFWES